MTKIGVTGLTQVAIVVDDVERAKAFYRDTLGLTHLFDAPPGLSFFQCGATRLMLSRGERPAAGGGAILYYGVPDAGAAQRVLQAGGVAFAEDARCIAEVGGKAIWLAICSDSEGNMIGLMSEQ